MDYQTEIRLKIIQLTLNPSDADVLNEVIAGNDGLITHEILLAFINAGLTEDVLIAFTDLKNLTGQLSSLLNQTKQIQKLLEDKPHLNTNELVADVKGIIDILAKYSYT